MDHPDGFFERAWGMATDPVVYLEEIWSQPDLRVTADARAQVDQMVVQVDLR